MTQNYNVSGINTSFSGNERGASSKTDCLLGLLDAEVKKQPKPKK